MPLLLPSPFPVLPLLFFVFNNPSSRASSSIDPTVLIHHRLQQNRLRGLRYWDRTTTNDFFLFVLLRFGDGDFLLQFSSNWYSHVRSSSFLSILNWTFTSSSRNSYLSFIFIPKLIKLKLDFWNEQIHHCSFLFSFHGMKLKIVSRYFFLDLKLRRNMDQFPLDFSFCLCFDGFWIFDESFILCLCYFFNFGFCFLDFDALFKSSSLMKMNRRRRRRMRMRMGMRMRMMMMNKGYFW